MKKDKEINIGIDVIPVKCRCNTYYNTKTKKYECMVYMHNKDKTTYIFMKEDSIHVE